MKTISRLGVLAVAALLAGSCQGRTGYFSGGAGGSGGGGRATSANMVSLTAEELAPIDNYISTRNSQWILGDIVEVRASKEYFGQALTMNATVGLHERTDSISPQETVVTLRYSGAPGSASVTTNPRVLIGTGLTITARKTLTVRLFKTTDGSRPVVLSVVARGDASYGRKEEVLDRGDELVVGGELQSIRGQRTWKPYR